MARTGLRIGILGATGALGGEVLAALADSGIAVAEIVAMAQDDSIGRDIELHGEVYPVEVGMTRVRGLDLLILCAPPAVSLEGVREALRASVPCLDASGVLAASPEVALQVAAFGAQWSPDAPLVVAPPGAALALALVLRPLSEAAGLHARVRDAAGRRLDGRPQRHRSALSGIARALQSAGSFPSPAFLPARSPSTASRCSESSTRAAAPTTRTCSSAAWCGCWARA